MANSNNATEEAASLSQDKWPHEPEGMIEFMPHKRLTLLALCGRCKVN